MRLFIFLCNWCRNIGGTRW